MKGPIVAALAMTLAMAAPARGGWEGDHYALSLEGGGTYIGEKVRFLIGSLLINLDPAERRGELPTLDPLHTRVELSLGSKVNRPRDPMAAAVAFAQYHLRGLDSPGFHPFLEAGLGLIYTGFRVRHQPLHLDFNPNLGLGFDLGPASAPDLYLSLRWHHISNANIKPPNNGVNSFAIVVAVPLR